MKLILSDPSLKDFDGHFYNYDKSIADAWNQNSKGQCFTLSNKSWTNFSDGFETIPAYSLGLEQIISGGEFLSHKNLVALAKKFAAETLLALSKLMEQEAPLLFFLHTTTPAQILALKYISQSKLNTTKNKFVVMLRYSPEINSLTPSKENVEAYRWVFNQVANSAINVIYVADSLKLSEEYRRLYKLSVKILPIPHTLNSSTSNFEVGRRTVGMLGPARSTKGFHFYPRLAAVLAARKDTHIVLQSQVLFNRDRDSLIAREILKNSPNVTLIEESLSQDDYHRILNSIDLLALPYQLAYYHSQTSGILAEGASLGKPCVIPKGTWMHEQLESNLVSGLAFEPGNVEDFVVNVQKVLDEFSRFKDIALARMSDWNKTHNALSFVSEIRNVVK